MDIKKYIDSGILEDYVLGLVSEKEAQAVEQNLKQYPELKTELNKIEDALATYAQAKARPMPKGLSKTILQSIQELETNPTADSDISANTAIPQATVPKSNNTLSIILGVALLGSLAGNFLLYQQKERVASQHTESQIQINELNERLTTLQLGCDEKDGTIQRLQEQIIILKNPAYQRIILKGTDKAPTAEAIVYFDAAADTTYFDKGSLPTPPSDKDYQLWALIDGQPTDMGILDFTSNWEDVIVVPNAQAFAITLEARDGNPAPNLEELYVFGEV